MEKPKVSIPKNFRLGWIARFFLFSAFVGVSCSDSQMVDSSVERTIASFSKTLAKKRVTELLPYVSNEPDYVHRQALIEFKKIHGINERVSTANTLDNGSVVAIGSHPPTYAGEGLVKKVVPTDLFFSQNRTVTKIVSIRRNGSEALASVEIEGHDSFDGTKFAALKYDILLNRVGADWKIFYLKLRNDGDDKYFEYHFYARPESSE